MKKIINIIFFMLSIWIFFSINTSVKAATATISASKQTATVGDKVTITTTIKAASWTLKVSGNGVASTGYTDVTDDANNTTVTKSLNLDTSKAGTYTVSLKGDVTDGDTGVTTSINTSTVITVNEKVISEPPKSGDATLKSITIGGKKYTGSALNNTISQTVESSVGSISISAEKNDSKAKISGTGTKSLIAGQTNSYTLTVTAENGNKKTYKVNIIRKAIENTEPNIIEDNKEDEEPKEELKLTTLVIKDVELNTEFKPEILNYIANVKNMTELEIEAIANKENAEIKIEGASELKEGDNTILITVVLGEENIQYKIDLYNKIEEEKEEEIKEEIPETKTTSFSIEDIKNYLIENWLTSSLLLIIFILAIISIIFVSLTYKYSKKIKELTGEDDDIIERDEDKNEKLYDDLVKERNKRTGKHF